MSYVKYQHYLARNHMSWFANADGTNSFLSLTDGRLQEGVKLTEIGGQNNLYEAPELERNFVEIKILNRVEKDFFAARSRAMMHRAVRKSDDRLAVRRYVAAQYVRFGHLHKRIVHLEGDLLFLVKEMGLERYFGAEGITEQGRRKRASALMAKVLVELDIVAEMLKQHVVIFVKRPQGDLLLPDRGFVQYYDENNKIRSDGLKSSNLKILMPIAPDAALKLIRPTKGTRFANSVTMSDKEHSVFIHNLSLNAKSFVVGTRQGLSAVDFAEMPYFDLTVERFSMVMQLYKAGLLDEIVDDIWSKHFQHIPKAIFRDWFYSEKFVPAINKLFNPTEDPNAVRVEFIP